VNSRDRAQVALDDGVDVALEEPGAPCVGAVHHRGIAADGNQLSVGGTADAGTADLRPAAVEQQGHKRLARPAKLTLAEGRQPEVLRTPGERVGDSWGGQDVRRTGQQELPGRRITVDSRLDRQQQVRHALDLIDDDRGDQSRDESRRIGRSRVARCRRSITVKAIRLAGFGSSAEHRHICGVHLGGSAESMPRPAD